MAESQEKTEAPTSKRLFEHKKRGEIPKSPELAFAMSFMAGLYLLNWCLPAMAEKTTLFWKDTLMLIPRANFDAEETIFAAGKTLFSVLAVFMSSAAVLALVFGAIPSGIPRVEVKFDIKRLNPIDGLKRFWRPESLVELVKNLLKLCVIGWVLYSEVKDKWQFMLNLSVVSTAQIAAGIMSALYALAWKAAAVMLVFGAADLAYRWWRLRKMQKMTKQEVTQERKDQDGNPLIKGKIKALQRQMSRRTRLTAVATANVVVVNPTHFAVALKYDRASMASPEVVAKGMDLMALKIIELAKANRVPIHHNVPLARSLYRLAEPGQSIPAALYKAVAEVFAWVYAENRRWNSRRA
jgi:flagellar biosynthesis protein FlhB